MLTNRKDAREAGHRFYLADRPCRNGHSSPRYVSTGHCSACLAAARGADQQAHAQAMAARFAGVRQFSYPLHPDDHAAALAFCQGLDLQRGRTPQVGQPVVATPAPAPAVIAAPDWLARVRAGQDATPPGLEGARPADHVPAEMRGVLPNQSDER